MRHVEAYAHHLTHTPVRTHTTSVPGEARGLRFPVLTPRLRKFLFGITPATMLVILFGVILSLEALSISPHTHALREGLHEKMWQATGNSDIKFLSR